jgi:tRNA-specific 2-thiouridylase
MIPSKTTVVVGMSGGVDSSVTALLLKQQGYRVIGMFMKNWEENDANGVCKASLEFEDVVKVCNHIDIPYYSVNFVKDYWDNVFSQFLEEFKKGRTPNPDILCNREIKFKVLLEKALALGADFLATGHYAQVQYDPNGNTLLKGKDPGKDQSYFLYTLKSDTLGKVMFPVGDMLKPDLRRLAREHQLPTSEKKDSTGICFIGKRDFKEFLSQYIQYHPGNFENLDGKIVGKHDGAAYYTIGQRKGMGLGGPGEPWFVVGKDMDRNVVYVEQGISHLGLFCDDLIAHDLTWISPEGAPQLPMRCLAKVRYRQTDQECILEKIENGKAFVKFLVPQRAVTPSQSVVFYRDNICLGGGIIQEAGPSYYMQDKELPLNYKL